MVATKRLSRSKRAAPHSRPPMVLTDRDKLLLQAVNDYQALLGRQLEALFFTSRSSAQFRLQKLYQHEFLDRHFMSVISGGPASSPILYTLGLRGQSILTQEFQYEPNHIRRFPKHLSWKFIDHLIQINDVRIAITRASQALDYSLERWIDELPFRQHPDYVAVTDKTGKTHDKPVYPDGYFCLSVPQGKAHFFLEIDRATEERSKFKPQIEVYEAYTHSGLYQERFQAKGLRILIITTTPERLANLKAVTKAAGGDRKYWFTTFNQVTVQSVLNEPIWERLESHDRFALIG